MILKYTFKKAITMYEGILNIAFRVADEDGLPLLDLKDLQALLVWIGENASSLALRYGNVSSASVGAMKAGLPSSISYTIAPNAHMSTALPLYGSPARISGAR